MSLESNINNLNRDKFISLFGVIFEKSQWIGEKLFDLKPFKDKDDLISKMIQIYETTSKNGILKVLRSHPKLAVEKNLTDYSNKEQKFLFPNPGTDMSTLEVTVKESPTATTIDTYTQVTDTVKVTAGYFSGNVGTLAKDNLVTASLSATQQNYYLNLQS